MDNLSWFARMSTAFWVIDNSDSDPALPPKLVATGKAGSGLEFLADDAFPELKTALLSISP